MSLPAMLRSVLVPLHPDGWKFVAIFAAGAVVLALIWQPLGWLGAILAAWCAYFFRDPPRVTPVRPRLVISPADGVVQAIGLAEPPPELDMEQKPRTRVSIFMNVFDVHVNRSPVDGEVLAVAYRAGKFFNASLDKASEQNERNSLRLRLDDGREVAVVQIAGLVARRIRSDTRQGAVLQAGQRFGLIRFGSRVDVYLPEGVSPLVIEGQRSVAGETVVADLMSGETARRGATR
jgi:phosphatidylserine decarboxylase